MIKSVIVTNDRNESLLLELSNPYDTGLAITSMTGIGPSKANINTTDLAIGDGSIYNSARVNSRNIVINFKLLEDPETNLVEDTRQRTYKYFPLKKMITLTFETDNRIAQIQGYVESNEPDIFQQEETAQVSIVCPSPYFYASDGLFVLNGIEPRFYFPFSNESVTENLIEFSAVRESLSAEYYYEGDAETGAIFHFHIVEDDVSNISIYNITTQERMDLNTDVISAITKDGHNLMIHDDIYLSTISSDRYIYLVRAGVTYNILPVLSKTTDWIRIVKGSNVFGYLATTGKLHVEIEIQTNILYEGV